METHQMEKESSKQKQKEKTKLNQQHEKYSIGCDRARAPQPFAIQLIIYLARHKLSS